MMIGLFISCIVWLLMEKIHQILDIQFKLKQKY